MGGATAYPIFPENCSGNRCGIGRPWSWLTCWDMTLSGRNGGIEYGKSTIRDYAICQSIRGLKSAISRPITSAQRKSTPVIPMWIPAEASTTSIWSNRPASTGPSQRGKLPLPDAVPGKTVSQDKQEKLP